MTFARQIPLPVIDLSRFVDTPRQAKDPCFHCTLWDCVVDEEPDKCPFLNTSYQVGGTERYSRRLESERQALIAELIDAGVIQKVLGNGFIVLAGDTETHEDRLRRAKREHMRRKRAEKRKKDDPTAAAVGELVQKGFEHYGGTGEADPTISRNNG